MGRIFEDLARIAGGGRFILCSPSEPPVADTEFSAEIVLRDRIEGKWIDNFAHVFRLCAVTADDLVAILSETQSREINVHLAELALLRLGVRPVHITLVTPPQQATVPVRSTGASVALRGDVPALAALKAASMVVDCTVEGLLHAPELGEILQSGARVLMISNEHPDALERLLPDPGLKPKVRAAVRMIREASRMQVTSAAGTDLAIRLDDAPAVGVWGYTDKPGTIAHWPGGIVVAFPRRGAVNGCLVLAAGDVNLTFKRYLVSPVTLTIEDDFVIRIDGEGADAELMRRYFDVWGERDAYATSHVGWGMNPAARYEALAMYDQRDTNGTELRAFAGNFLYSTGANEFAGRFTQGHFDLPVRNCTIALDDDIVVRAGALQGELA